MPIGFEIAFPSLLEFAKKLKLGIRSDSPALQQINARRALKLARYIVVCLITKVNGRRGRKVERRVYRK